MSPEQGTTEAGDLCKPANRRERHVNLKQLAGNVLQLLQGDPIRYRNFGVYWYFVKEIMKHYYTRDNLYLLGDYRDEGVVERMPRGLSLDAVLREALEQYGQNFRFGMGSNRFTDSDGEEFILLDSDAGF